MLLPTMSLAKTVPPRGTEPRYQNQTDVHAELHQRAVPGYNLFRILKLVKDLLGYVPELFDFIRLPHIGFYHPDGVQIFLNHAV